MTKPAVAQVSQALAPSVARTTAGLVVLYEHDGDDYVGVTAIVDVTADPALASVVFGIEGFDPVSGKWIALLASAAVAAVGSSLLTVSPHVATVANVSRQMRLPRHWRLVGTHADTDSITYSVGGWMEQGL